MFAQHGYGGTTIEDIAQAAEVTVGTIYRYFRDKEALLHEIVAWTASMPLLSFDEAGRRPDPSAHLGHLAATIWTASRRAPHVHALRLLVAESGNAPELVERYRARVLEPVERELAAALEALGQTSNSTVTARALLGALLGASLLAGSPGAPTPVVPQPAPLDVTVDALVRGFIDRPAPPGPSPTSLPDRPNPPRRPRAPDSW